MRLWRRVFRCTICHGTGVVMTGQCDCGHPGWSYEPHEAHCGEYPCPAGCKIVATREDALLVWRRYLPGSGRSWVRP